MSTEKLNYGLKYEDRADFHAYCIIMNFLTTNSQYLRAVQVYDTTQLSVKMSHVSHCVLSLSLFSRFQISFQLSRVQ